MYFCNFVIISPWKRLGPWFEQIWIPYTQGWFMLSLVEIGLVVLEKKIFLNLSMYFCNFVIISPWKRAGSFIWTNLNSLYLRMLFAKFGWNWPTGSGEEVEMWQRQRRRQQRQQRTTYKFLSEKLTWAFGSGELKMASGICYI